MTKPFAALISALCLVAAMAVAPSASGDPAVRVAVIGDSYTTGSDMGGQGRSGWPALAWQMLAGQGLPIAADVAAEGGAGYGMPGNRGSMFGALTARAVRPDDALVVFFGSRNDQPIDPQELAAGSGAAFALARRTSPAARVLVIGPPWPTPDVPPAVLQIRDVLKAQAIAVGATFFDPLTARWFFDTPALIGADGVHPTDAGHMYLADRIAPLIAAQLTGVM